MLPALQFHVVNPEPLDPLTRLRDSGRAAVVSRSSTASRAYALWLAACVVRTTGQALVIVDAPAVYHHLCAEIARHGVTTTVRFVHPDALPRSKASLRDCLLLANYAVASKRKDEGRYLAALLHDAHSAILALRPRDLSVELHQAVSGTVVDLDTACKRVEAHGPWDRHWSPTL